MTTLSTPAAIAAEAARAQAAEATKVNSSTYTAGLAGKMALQQVAATVTADGAAVVNKHNPVDATSGTRAITLPTGQTEGTQVSIEKTDASANVVNITGNIRGVAATTIPLAFLSESLMLRADSAGSWWPIAGHRTKASLDAAYGPTATQTLTNKRVTRRVDTTTSAATYTFSWDNFDAAKITAQAAALNLANPTGTPTAMQPVVIRIKDDGTARAITYGTQFRAIGVTLPTTTVVGKTLYLGGMWNSEDSKLDVVAVGQEA